MLRASVTPLDREEFGLQKSVAVSETDREGRITAVNDAFLRASGYSMAELVGQPHSVVRHPDMPRSIFTQMWQKLHNGEEIFFYVENRTKDGRSHWELAHVTPRFDAAGGLAGYRSVRRPADAEEVAHIEPFYRKIRKLERNASKGAADNSVIVAA